MPMMWDRLKTSQKQVGGGALVDDERIRLSMAYSHTRNSSTTTKKGGYSYSIKGGPAPPRPPREFFESHQYEIAVAPAVQEPPPRNPARITLRAANTRPTSSVYSQDTTTTTRPKASNYTVTVATKYGYRYGGVEEISPPSSPEPDAEGVIRFLPGDVSPIEEEEHPNSGQQYAAVPNTGAPSHSNGNHEHRNQTASQDTGRQSPRGSSNNGNSRGGATSIPMMRRERRKQSDAAVRGAHSNQRGAMAPQQHRNPPPTHQDNAQEAPRWDPLTGERTTSDRGRPSQVNPAELSQGLGISSHAWASPVNSPTQAPPSFTDRVRRIAKKAGAVRDREKETDTDPAAGAFTSTRPGWRGASGRTAIVDPVHDTPEVAPLRIPEKSSRRNIPPAHAPEPMPDLLLGGALRRGQTPPISPPATETPTSGTRSGPREIARNNVQVGTQQTPHVTQLRPEHGQSYPSPPLSGTPLGGDAPAVAAVRELARDGFPNVTALPSPTLNANYSPDANVIRRKPPPLQINHQHQGSVSSVSSQPPQAAQPPPLQIPQFAPPAPAAATDAWVQPPSRFSVTTYATSNTGTTRDEGDEGVDEDQPPVPSIPAGLQITNNASRSSDNSPITSPIDQFMASPFNLHSEPLPMTPPANPAIARAQAIERIERPDSRASDMNKSLPPAPPEASAGEAQDRVGMLDARLRALANRRININRSITQMTEMMPTDKLMNSEEVVRKREIEKKKVEALKQELADVQREEYELGMKLHRAYKRLDRDADLTTTLWVRRVTT
ncbi:hypothetical protein QBC35DRAFT_249710 [Podospora australis]|uniref:Uncharacterized protein n=1 Tax=Podospora australis TaxID=1536484 RepID=A0AAN6WTH7_9PEZI|nr:hypothetical protein QBC35DRAFT_249710 [Podospora australis]